jgi:nucleoside 2-deoxyribosyltransferase
MTNNKTIYFASSMFNVASRYFNLKIVREIEKLGYKVFLPQRDGFSFTELTVEVAKHLETRYVSSAVRDVIYCLDVGCFVRNCDVLVCLLDEPIDEGVIIELMQAKYIGKYVIGLRTDIRSPYGTIDDHYGGIHFFPTYQTDTYIVKYLDSTNFVLMNKEIRKLVEQIDLEIEENVTCYSNQCVFFGKSKEVMRFASLLFDGISDIHSKHGLSEIVRRYVCNYEEFPSIRTKIIR